ncbi:MAG: hypothetical protein ACOCTG_00295 [Bacteroidota bacterium]
MAKQKSHSGLDQRNDRIVIDRAGTMTPVVAAVQLVAHYKNLNVTYADLDGPLVPTIAYRRIYCSGFWPIIRFLNRIRPYPCIHPLDPDDQTMHDSQCEIVLVDSRAIDVFYARYADPKTETQYLGLQGRAPDLLDFVIASYAYTSLVSQHEWLRWLLDELEVQRHEDYA